MISMMVLGLFNRVVGPDRHRLSLAARPGDCRALADNDGQIRRSYWVATAHIVHVEWSGYSVTVALSDGQHPPVSRGNRATLKQVLAARA